MKSPLSKTIALLLLALVSPACDRYLYDPAGPRPTITDAPPSQSAPHQQRFFLAIAAPTSQDSCVGDRSPFALHPRNQTQSPRRNHMQTLSLRPALLSILALFTLSLPACSKEIDGKYISSGGLWTLEFKSGKATLSGMGESETTDYTVDGDKITIKSKKGVGGLVLMRMKDGSLEGGFGTFKKSAG